MNKTLKKLIFPSIYLLAILIVTICVLIVGNSMTKYLEKNNNYNYTDKEVLKNETNTPVMAEKTKIIKPYKTETVTIGKSFYDYQADASTQEKSIYFYENTYMQNSVVEYINNEPFEIVSVLDGEIIDVKPDETLGNIIEVKHDGEVITIYQGLEKINVKKGDKVTQGQVLGISGKSKVNPDYKSFLHFEVFHKGELLNPETFYTLDINDLK